MSESSTLFVGLDVHKQSIDVALAFPGRKGELRHVGTIKGDLTALDKSLRKVVSLGYRLHVVYEAGPFGFVVWRHLTAQGLSCEVVAPSSIARPSGDRIKTDRRDALLLARLARSGDLTAVRVPTEADEAVRDVVRAREDAVREQRNGRHRLKALLLRNGVSYSGRSSWTDAHLHWLSSLKLPLPAQQIASQEYLHMITEATRRIARLEQAMLAVMPEWRLAPVVQALQGMPGAVAVLHTHNRPLGLHPHVHVCMPAAAFNTAERIWRTKVKLGRTPGSPNRPGKPARGGYLFNHKALGKVFAGKLKAALTTAGLTLPANLPEQWVVDCKAVGDGQQTLRYLGRYLYRGVISERDILRCTNGQVTYRWRDAKSGKPATRTLPAEDFLWLLLQHVLPKGLQRARNFGVLHHNARRTLALVQLTQATPGLADTAPPPARPVWRCACGQPMVIVRRRMRPTSSGPSCAAPQTTQPDKAKPLEAATH